MTIKAELPISIKHKVLRLQNQQHNLNTINNISTTATFAHNNQQQPIGATHHQHVQHHTHLQHHLYHIDHLLDLSRHQQQHNNASNPTATKHRSLTSALKTAASADSDASVGASTLAKTRQRAQIQSLLLAAFAYIVSPIDLVPEVIFGVFGILDDILFLFMCLFCVAIILVYPLFAEMRRKLLKKLGLLRDSRQQPLPLKSGLLTTNRKF